MSYPINNNGLTPRSQINPLALAQHQDDIDFMTSIDGFAQPFVDNFSNPIYNGAYCIESPFYNNFGAEFLSPMGQYTPPCNSHYLSPFSQGFSPMFHPFLSLPNSTSLHPMSTPSQNFFCPFSPKSDLILPQSFQTMIPERPSDVCTLNSGKDESNARFALSFKPMLLNDSPACNQLDEPVATVTSILGSRNGLSLNVTSSHLNATNSVETPLSLLAQAEVPQSLCLNPYNHSIYSNKPEQILADETFQKLEEKSNDCHFAEESVTYEILYKNKLRSQVNCKQHHKISEQQRRAALAGKFKELASKLQGKVFRRNANSLLSSQCDILAATTQYINEQRKQYIIQYQLLSFLRKKFDIKDDSTKFPLLPTAIPLVARKDTSDLKYPS